jgi:hypothetical protein
VVVDDGLEREDEVENRRKERTTYNEFVLCLSLYPFCKIAPNFKVKIVILLLYCICVVFLVSAYIIIVDKIAALLIRNVI